MQSTNDDNRFAAYLQLVIAKAGVSDATNLTSALVELHAYHNEWNLWESVPEDVLETLSMLRAKGLTLVVLSNANGTLKKAFERIGLSGAVDLIFDSHEEGVEKPDPKYFHLALSACNATANRTLHVGDFYHIDVTGARKAGIRPILLDSAGLYDDCDCTRIRSLAELNQLID